MDEQKDQNVYSFMMQLVQERYSDEADLDFLNQESDRLYEIFGDVLLEYFEPQLEDEQKKMFDQLIENNESQDNLLNFLIENISDLEQQIIQVLVKFRNDYLAGKLEKTDPRYTNDEAEGETLDGFNDAQEL